jgi:hypothetical protein
MAKSLETLDARSVLVLKRQRRVVGVARRVWPSGQMMVARGTMKTLDELEVWRIGRAAEEGE